MGSASFFAGSSVAAAVSVALGASDDSAIATVSNPSQMQASQQALSTHQLVLQQEFPPSLFPGLARRLEQRPSRLRTAAR
jgi:hypothetical protein